MKIRLFGIATLFLFGAPLNAASVLQMPIIQCGATGEVDGCGSNPGASDPLKFGEVQVRKDGTVFLKLVGAVPNKNYTVVMANWVIRSNAQHQFSGRGTGCPSGFEEISEIRTDKDGDFIGNLFVFGTQEKFTFPSDVKIGQVNFAINETNCLRTQFSSGLSLQ